MKTVQHRSASADNIKIMTKGESNITQNPHVTQEELLELFSDSDYDEKKMFEDISSYGIGRSLTLYNNLSPSTRVEIAAKRDIFFAEEDIKIAAKEAVRGHIGKWDIDDFIEDFDNKCHEMYLDLCNNTWWEKCQYRELDKTNTNGKRRHIDSPNLYLRILEHLWLLYIVPLYDEQNIKVGVARNCLPDHGITAKIKEYSVVKEMKNLFYDKRHYKYLLVMDQRKCYPHITPKEYRKSIKLLTHNKFLIDFGEKVSFVGKRLPIGTPTSPYIHNIVMLPFDIWLKEKTTWCLRYADDNAIAFDNKADAQEMKWRIQNYWWYEQHIRAKSRNIRILDMDKESIDFCGYIFHRFPNKRISDHNKGITLVRKATLKRAINNTNPDAWGSYFGILRHADAYKIIRQIEENHKMEFSELSKTIKIHKELDAATISVQQLAEQAIPFTIISYKLEFDSTNEPNWCKCLIAIPTEDLVVEPTTNNVVKVNKLNIMEFHGAYKYMSKFLYEASMSYPSQSFLPLTNVVIEDSNGYIFKNSTDRITKINNDAEYQQLVGYYLNEQIQMNNEMFTDPNKVKPESLQRYNQATCQNLTMRAKPTNETLPNVSRAGYKNSYKKK